MPHIYQFTIIYIVLTSVHERDWGRDYEVLDYYYILFFTFVLSYVHYFGVENKISALSLALPYSRLEELCLWLYL